MAFYTQANAPELINSRVATRLLSIVIACMVFPSYDLEPHDKSNPADCQQFTARLSFYILRPLNTLIRNKSTMTFAKPVNLSVQVAHHLADKIIRGDLTPGSRILETNLANDLQISRGPIREALLILNRQRLIKILPRRGAVVTELFGSQVIELYDVITALFRLLTQQLCKKWQPQDLQALEQILNTMKAHANEQRFFAYFTETKALIQQALSICDHELLSLMIDDLLPSVDRVQYLSLRQRQDALQDNLNLWLAIFEEIKARNTDALDALIESMNHQEKQHALRALSLIPAEL